MSSTNVIHINDAIKVTGKAITRKMERPVYFQTKQRKVPSIGIAEAKKILWNVATEYINDFNVDVYNKEAITRLLGWFMADESCGLDLFKGIWLHGPRGTGKTDLMEIFRRFTVKAGLLSFRAIKSKDIVNHIETSESLYDMVKFSVENYLFDDIGREIPKLQKYGNTICPVEVLADAIYEANKTRTFYFVTSNFPPDHPRVRIWDDRTHEIFADMFNVVELPGPNRRKK